MIKFALFSFLLQSINVSYSSITPFDLTTNPETSHVIHRPINVSHAQGYEPRRFTIAGEETNILAHNVRSDGDCLFYALGISEPPLSLRDLDHPWETKNRTFALMEIAKKRDHFHPSNLYKLALILKSHLDVFDDQRLYLCYPNRDIFNLAMAYRLSKAGQLNDFLNGTEQGQQLRLIFNIVERNINLELLEIPEKSNKSIQLLKEILQLKLPGQDLNSYIKEKLKSSFNELMEFNRDQRSLEDPLNTRRFRSLCFQAFAFIMSTRLYISDEFCTFLAPALGKNILVWTKNGEQVSPQTYYPIIDVAQNFEERLDIIHMARDIAFAKEQLQDPNTYHILYDGGHFQALTTIENGMPSHEDSIEMINARIAADQPAPPRPSSSIQYDLSTMSEDEQMAAAIAASLNL